MKKEKPEQTLEPRKSVRDKKQVKAAIVSEVIVKKKKTRRYKCGGCPKRFPRKYGIRDGKRYIIPVPVNFFCPKCTEKKKKLKNSRRIRARLKRPELHCDVCGMVKHDKYAIRIHVQKHLNLKCNVCSIRHVASKSLILHLKSHFTNHCCQYCGITINNVHTFKKHIRIHENRFKQSKRKGPEDFECEHCGKKFVSSLNLSCHIEKQHKDGAEGTYKCNKCPKVFADRQLHRTHSLEHHEGKVYYCEFEGCKKFFFRSKTLRTHSEIHSEEPKFHCTDCGKKYFQRSNLYTHRKKENACKAKKPQLSTDEQQRIEKIARAQIAEFVVKKYTPDASLMKRLSRLKAIDEDNEVSQEVSDEESKSVVAKEEIEDTEAKIEVKHSSNEIEFENIYIKEEPDVEITIKEEVFEMEVETETSSVISNDVCVIKVEPVEKLQSKNEFTSLEPVVVLQRLDPAELLKWKVVDKKVTSAKPKPSAKKDSAVEAGRYGPNFATGTQVKKSGYRYPCQAFYCTFSADFQDILHRHRRKRHFEKLVNLKTTGPFICDLCNQSVCLKTSLVTHLTKIHKPATIECHLCIRKFKTKQNLKKHIYVRHDDVNFLYFCDICGYKAKFLVSLKRHMRKCHNLEKPKWECPKCHKVVQTYSKIEHVKRCGNPIAGPKLACDVCGKMVTNVKTHFASVHSKSFNGKAYDCSKCEETFKRKRDLTMHEIEKHLGGKGHECFCGKLFPKKKLLTAHSKFHSGEIHRCDLCPGKKFRYNASLFQHRRKKHPVEYQRDKEARNAKLAAEAFARSQR